MCLRQEAKALVAAGYEVTVICPQGKNQGWHETIDGVRAYRYPMPSQGDGLLGYLWEYGYSLPGNLLSFIACLLQTRF